MNYEKRGVDALTLKCIYPFLDVWKIFLDLARKWDGPNFQRISATESVYPKRLSAASAGFAKTRSWGRENRVSSIATAWMGRRKRPSKSCASAGSRSGCMSATAAVFGKLPRSTPSGNHVRGIREGALFHGRIM